VLSVMNATMRSDHGTWRTGDVDLDAVSPSRCESDASTWKHRLKTYRPRSEADRPARSEAVHPTSSHCLRSRT
jgi:hypothetical protein